MDFKKSNLLIFRYSALKVDPSTAKTTHNFFMIWLIKINNCGAFF